MFPTLSIGSLSVPSFGIFLALGFLLGIFLVWRLARAWDLDEEKVLDLTLLTFVGGLFGARVYFAILNPYYFIKSPLNLIMINKLPGFSFWGGVLGGWLILYFFTRRKHLNFWQIADIASVGLIGGLILSNIGCFLGGCNIGVFSKAFFSVTMLGSLGRRWPVQLVEAVLLTISLSYIWSQATHFHQRGKIVSLGFILIGAIKLILEPFKQDHSGIIFSSALVLLGVITMFKVTKQSPKIVLKSLGKFCREIVSNPQARNAVIQKLSKNWYNQKTEINWKLRNLGKKIGNLRKFLKKSNVKFS